METTELQSEMVAAETWIRETFDALSPDERREMVRLASEAAAGLGVSCAMLSERDGKRDADRAHFIAMMACAALLRGHARKPANDGDGLPGKAGDELRAMKSKLRRRFGKAPS